MSTCRCAVTVTVTDVISIAPPPIVKPQAHHDHFQRRVNVIVVCMCLSLVGSLF